MTVHHGGGRSGNDYLARGGEGYESWAAEGPSGTAAEGGPPATGPRYGLTSSGSAAIGQGRSSSTLTLLVGAGIGAALMYFLDGTEGARRRRLVADKLRGAVRAGREAARDATEGTRERVQNAASGVRERIGGDEPTDELAGTGGATGAGTRTGDTFGASSYGMSSGSSSSGGPSFGASAHGESSSGS